MQFREGCVEVHLQNLSKELGHLDMDIVCVGGCGFVYFKKMKKDILQSENKCFLYVCHSYLHTTYQDTFFSPHPHFLFR